MDADSYAYPACHDLSLLSDEALAVKIARHSTCSLCDCTGLKPAPEVKVVLKTGFDPLATDFSLLLNTCFCTHGVEDHGNPVNLDHDEQIRRAKVAIRLDELLSVRVFLSFFAHLVIFQLRTSINYLTSTMRMRTYALSENRCVSWSTNSALQG